MDKVRISRIEQLKNIAIVVLVFTTILLLYFLWGNESLEAFIFNEDEQNYEVIDSEKVIVPDQIVISLGNEDYTVAYGKEKELWNNQMVKAFVNFTEGENILVEEITKEQYQTVIKYPSIVAKFGYDISFAGFSEKFGLKQHQGFDNIGHLTELGFSRGSMESAFLYDGNKKRYYRMVGSSQLPMFNAVDDIVSRESLVTYYTLKTFLGKESTNETLVPLELPQQLETLEYQSDSILTQKEMVNSIAQSYFGKTFDFVKQVEESNGTTIYMYGYGQKVLIISPSGSIEYKEEVKGSTSEQFSMFQCLDVALNFVGAHGGFETIAGQTLQPSLEEIAPLGDKKNGYRFVFSFMLGSSKMFYEEQMPLIIEVTDGQVSYFRREYLNFKIPELEEASNGNDISAINMLAMNDKYIRDVLVKRGSLDMAQGIALTFEDVADMVQNLYIGYLKPKQVTSLQEENQGKQTVLQLIPVWVVEIDRCLLYFDLYDGTPMGYSESYK